MLFLEKILSSRHFLHFKIVFVYICATSNYGLSDYELVSEGLQFLPGGVQGPFLGEAFMDTYSA